MQKRDINAPSSHYKSEVYNGDNGGTAGSVLDFVDILECIDLIVRSTRCAHAPSFLDVSGMSVYLGFSSLVYK
jgi:hypothetical protein